jgi:hypothetical protein
MLVGIEQPDSRMFCICGSKPSLKEFSNERSSTCPGVVRSIAGAPILTLEPLIIAMDEAVSKVTSSTGAIRVQLRDAMEIQMGNQVATEIQAGSLYDDPSRLRPRWYS